MPTADDAPWQPWTPRVGQRVRVRRSAECPQYAHILTASLDDGATGTVLADCRPEGRGHPYLVVYDRPIPTGIDRPSHVTRQRYAAIELEPMDRSGDSAAPKPASTRP